MATEPTNYVFPDVAETDWARLAAFIDGEGCIKITSGYDHRRKGIQHRYRFTVEICNTDPRLSQWCKQLWGGVIVYRDMKNRRWKNSYSWLVSERRAEAITKRCLPYFVIKREQAEVALAYRATFKFQKTISRRDPVSGRIVGAELMPEIKIKRAEYMAQLSFMKRRGNPEEAVQ